MPNVIYHHVITNVLLLPWNLFPPLLPKERHFPKLIPCYFWAVMYSTTDPFVFNSTVKLVIVSVTPERLHCTVYREKCHDHTFCGSTKPSVSIVEAGAVKRFACKFIMSFVSVYCHSALLGKTTMTVNKGMAVGIQHTCHFMWSDTKHVHTAWQSHQNHSAYSKSSTFTCMHKKRTHIHVPICTYRKG